MIDGVGVLEPDARPIEGGYYWWLVLAAWRLIDIVYRYLAKPPAMLMRT